MGDDDAPKAMTAEEVQALLDAKDRDAKMSDEEKSIRAIVRDETGSIFEEKFNAFLDAVAGPDTSKPGDTQKPGGQEPKTRGLLDAFLGRTGADE